MPRKQINVSVDPEVYERIQAAAWDDHLTPAAWCRSAVLDALDNQDSGGEDGGDDPDSGIATWFLTLLAMLGSPGRRTSSAKH